MSRKGIVLTFISLLFLVALSASGQKNVTTVTGPSKAEREAKDKADSRKKEDMGKELRKWLDEDVAFIITDQEVDAFELFTTDEERETFIEQFWLRRDPSPETVENEYRDEYYARIAYANEHFASGVPGWKTDRGRIYIMHGPPDQKDASKAMGGMIYRRPEEGGGTTATFPHEYWWYRNIDGVGTDIELEFVDDTMSGEYRLTYDCSAKDAFKNVPGTGLTALEEREGLTDKSNRHDENASNLTGPMSTPCKFSTFDRLRQYTDVLLKAPEIKFKDLETISKTRIAANLLPIRLRKDFVKVTDDQVMVPLTVQIDFKDLSFKNENGVYRALVHFRGDISNPSRKRIGQPFEQTGDIILTPEQYKNIQSQKGVYQNIVWLKPGLYRLDLVVKDMNSGNLGQIQDNIQVPRFASQGLSTSTLILADLMQPLSPREVGGGQFVIGGTKVRPSVVSEFRREQDLNVWAQVYNLKVDDLTHKPSATVEVLITHNGEEVKRIVENSAELANAAQQMTVGRTVPLADFEPGQYSVQLKVTDNLTKDVHTTSGKFSVR